MFQKSLDKLEFQDIKKFKDNKIPESKVLDYKREQINKKDLLKQVCGFANANGGYLIFGIEESDDKPPLPKELIGCTKENFNIEQVEQIITSNVEPILKVEISPPVYKDESEERFFIVIRIPEGPDKPYISTVDDRFYFRHNYQTRRMSELEISSMYRQRFSTPQRVNEYIEETLDYHKVISLPLEKKDKSIIFGHFFIFPTNIERRRIEITDISLLKKNPEEIIKLDNVLSFEDFTSKSYNQFGFEWNDGRLPPQKRLEIHRNGLVHYVGDYGSMLKNMEPFFDITYFAESSLTTVNYTERFYEDINYFGLLTLMIVILDSKGLNIGSFESTYFKTQSKEIKIERECYSWELSDKYVYILKNMFDEFYNYFGIEKYRSFKGKERHILTKLW